MSTNATEQSTDIEEFLRTIHDGNVFEVRSPKCPDRRGGSYLATANGFFRDPAKAARAIRELEQREPPAIYVTCNAVSTELLALAYERITKSQSATSDSNIVRRRWLPIDIDPIRQAGISSTDAEMEAAIQLGDQIEVHLSSNGWPSPIRCMSGNGSYLLYRIDLPNDEESKVLVESCLKALSSIFDSSTCKVDTSMFNASRIIKLCGTFVRKGDNLQGVEGIPDRPHRRSWFMPGSPGVVDIGLLKDLAAITKPEAKTETTWSSESRSFNIEDWIREFNVPVNPPKNGTNGRVWVFKELPKPCEHSPSGHGNDGTAHIIERSDGVLGAGCKHDRCSWWGWKELREAYEPGCYDNRTKIDPGVNLDGILTQKPSEPKPPIDTIGYGVSVDRTSEITGNLEVMSCLKKFPTEYLPDGVREFVEAGSTSIGCDPSMIALPLLSCIGATIGTSRRVELKQSWTEPPVIWTAVVGESGTSKTPAFTFATQPFDSLQSRWLRANEKAMEEYEQQQAIYERDMAEWKKGKDKTKLPPTKPDQPEARRLKTTNATIEALVSLLRSNPKGMLLAIDELSGWLGSFDRYANGSGDVAHWLSMFNGGAITVDRKTGIARTLYVKSAAVSVCGGIQPGILVEMLGKKHVENGLAARLLLAHPPRVAKKWTESSVPRHIIKSMENIALALSGLEHETNEYDEQESVIVTLSPKAKQLFISYYDSHNEEQTNLSGSLSASWSKLECYAARLALIHHCCRCANEDSLLLDALEIDEVSMQSAIELTEWFKHETKRIHRTIGLTPEQQQDNMVYRLLCSFNEPATARETYRSAQTTFDSTEDVELSLHRLILNRKVESVPVNPTQKGGRPTSKFKTL